MYDLCVRDEWEAIFHHVRANPMLGVMYPPKPGGDGRPGSPSHCATILHEAITSKKLAEGTAPLQVVRQILCQSVQAAQMRDGFGFLPIHTLSARYRTLQLDEATKEGMFVALIMAYRAGLVQLPATSMSTPLHMLLTGPTENTPRYSNLVKAMIENGLQACYMKDAKGRLPIHVACEHGCSLNEFWMLLAANPGAVREVTSDGRTLLSLAECTQYKNPNPQIVGQLKSLSASAGMSTNFLYQQQCNSRPGAHFSAYGLSLGPACPPQQQLTNQGNLPHNHLQAVSAQSLPTPVVSGSTADTANSSRKRKAQQQADILATEDETGRSATIEDRIVDDILGGGIPIKNDIGRLQEYISERKRHYKQALGLPIVEFRTLWREVKKRIREPLDIQFSFPVPEKLAVDASCLVNTERNSDCVVDQDVGRDENRHDEGDGKTDKSGPNVVSSPRTGSALAEKVLAALTKKRRKKKSLIVYVDSSAESGDSENSSENTSPTSNIVSPGGVLPPEKEDFTVNYRLSEAVRERRRLQTTRGEQPSRETAILNVECLKPPVITEAADRLVDDI